MKRCVKKLVPFLMALVMIFVSGNVVFSAPGGGIGYGGIPDLPVYTPTGVDVEPLNDPLVWVEMSTDDSLYMQNDILRLYVDLNIEGDASIAAFGLKIRYNPDVVTPYSRDDITFDLGYGREVLAIFGEDLDDGSPLPFVILLFTSNGDENYGIDESVWITDIAFVVNSDADDGVFMFEDYDDDEFPNTIIFFDDNGELQEMFIGLGEVRFGVGELDFRFSVPEIYQVDTAQNLIHVGIGWAPGDDYEIAVPVFVVLSITNADGVRDIRFWNISVPLVASMDVLFFDVPTFDGDEIKVMIWDNTTTMNPLAEASEIYTVVIP